MFESHAFVDEYGDTSLNVQGRASCFFIISAVIVRDSELGSQRLCAEAIREKYFGPGEMKSSSIAKKDRRRLAVLDDLAGLSITSFTLAVDKRAVHTDSGLRWKTAFFKFLNRRLYERLFRTIRGIRLVADEHGGHDFILEFEKYVDRNHQRDLFSQREFSMANSRSEVLLQVADIVAGSWARVVDPQKRSDRADDIFASLDKHSAGIEVWPPSKSAPASSAPADAEVDECVRSHCLRQAQLFLKEHAANRITPEDRAVQSSLLLILLSDISFGSRSYIPTGRIREALRAKGYDLTERKVRSAVSALRDAGVIIGSSPQGIKIPTSLEDVRQFVSHANSIIPPMVGRLQRARADLKLVSEGAVDILAGKEFSSLRTLVESPQ